MPSYDFRIAGTADWQWTPDELKGALDGPVVALHSGSLALTMQPGAAVLRELMVQAAATATISYDPNCRPMLMGDPADVLAGVHELLAVADVVKVSSEDLALALPRPHARGHPRGLARSRPGHRRDHARQRRRARGHRSTGCGCGGRACSSR